MSSRRVRIVFLLAVVLLATVRCPGHSEQAAQSTTQAAATTACSTGASVDLDCAAFPNTDVVQQPDWDHFAWNTFIAANWPAVDPAKNNNQRGIPDVNKSFAHAASNALLTWETYKEKREVFYPSGVSTKPVMWNKPTNYGPLAARIPMCTPAGYHPPVIGRAFLQSGKIPNSLDETVQVPSEAIESQEQLCAGVTNPNCGTKNAADCCSVKGLAVSPRVWKGKPYGGRQVVPVLYEVKVNYDFFQYVISNSLYLDQMASNSANSGEIHLPFRTSAAAKPKKPEGSTPSTTSGTTGPILTTVDTFNYSAAKAMHGYKTKVTPMSQVTPALSGAVQLKAAWIRLLPGDDKSKYHTAEALYFSSQPLPPPILGPPGARQGCFETATFGLVGLHIIQRIHQGTGTTADPHGGTFIFATWEHVSNDGAGFTYSNHYGGTAPPAKGFYPTASAALPVKRRFPILSGTQAVNNEVHRLIRARNPNSVWLNYQLVGTQFQAMNVAAATNPTAPGTPPQSGTMPPATMNVNDPTNIGQPLYLANTVIETNEDLQKFQGLPPMEKLIARFKEKPFRIKPNTNIQFKRDFQNLGFQGQGYNMGGCMGCHGVAQLDGYSFSFVLLLGQRGAVIDTQTYFPEPKRPPPPTTTTTPPAAGQKNSG